MEEYKIVMEGNGKELVIEVTKEINDSSSTVFKYYTNDDVLAKVINKKIPKDPCELMMYFLKHQTSKKLHVII